MASAVAPVPFAVPTLPIEVNRRRPVLVVTDCVDMRCYLDAMWLGATDYLEKPHSPEQLLKTVRMFLHAGE